MNAPKYIVGFIIYLAVVLLAATCLPMWLAFVLIYGISVVMIVVNLRRLKKE